MSGHTPWRYQEESDVYTHIIREAPGRFILQLRQDTSGQTETLARSIVRDHNCHDDLVAALVDCRRLIEHMAEYVGQMALPDYALFNEAPIKADAALKKAGAQP